MPQQKKEHTRGEKCIFSHIIVTFSLILVLLIIFFIHLGLVKHSTHDVLRVFRRSGVGDAGAAPVVASDPFARVGVAYLAGPELRVLCTALLLKAQWSLVPGHCAAARAEPDLAEHLPGWRLRYKGADGVDTAVRKSVPHPQFDRDNFANNVGVLQHEIPVPIDDFIYPTVVVEKFSEDLELVGWDWIKHGEHRIKQLSVYPMPTEECQHFVSSITEVRPPYEFCVITGESNQGCFDHGALVYSHQDVLGFFSWGERCARTAAPLIIVNIKTFEEWLEGITSLKI